MKSKPFIDDMLYVVDGELMNHMLKICKRFGSMNPEYEKVLTLYHSKIYIPNLHYTSPSTFYNTFVNGHPYNQNLECIFDE